MSGHAAMPRTPGVNAIVAPERVKADLRYLWPDLRRPGMILSWASDPATAAAPSEPPVLFERVERGLAEAANRYRRILATAGTLIVMPLLLGWGMFIGLIPVPPGVHSPFTRGEISPLLSFYELAAFILLAVVLGYAVYVAYRSSGTLSRLSADLRRLREADAEQMAAFAAEASTGRWPRTAAMLVNGRPFTKYRELIVESDAAAPAPSTVQPPASADEPAEEPADAPAVEPEPDATREPLTAVHWRVGTALAIAALVVVVTLGAAVVAGLSAAFLDSRWATTVVTAIALSVSYVAAIALVWWRAGREGVGLAPAVGMRPVSAGLILGVGLAAALGTRLLAGVWALGLEALGVELPGANLDPTRMLPSGTLGIVFTILIACVLAPVAEEIVFRGVLLSALRERYGDASAIALSSLAFALVHVSLFAIPPIFVFALLLGWLFVRTRSLWVSIAAHAMFNALGVGALYALKGSGLL